MTSEKNEYIDVPPGCHDYISSLLLPAVCNIDIKATESNQRNILFIKNNVLFDNSLYSESAIGENIYNLIMNKFFNNDLQLLLKFINQYGNIEILTCINEQLKLQINQLYLMKKAHNNINNKKISNDYKAIEDINAPIIIDNYNDKENDMQNDDEKQLINLNGISQKCRLNLNDLPQGNIDSIITYCHREETSSVKLINRKFALAYFRYLNTISVYVMDPNYISQFLSDDSYKGYTRMSIYYNSTIYNLKKKIATKFNINYKDILLFPINATYSATAVFYISMTDPLQKFLKSDSNQLSLSPYPLDFIFLDKQKISTWSTSIESKLLENRIDKNLMFFLCYERGILTDILVLTDDKKIQDIEVYLKNKYKLKSICISMQINTMESDFNINFVKISNEWMYSVLSSLYKYKLLKIIYYHGK